MQEKRKNRNGFRQIVMTQGLIVILTIVMTMEAFAGSGEWYSSKTGLYSFQIPDGFSYYSVLESMNQEVFVSDDNKTFNIAYTEEALFGKEMLSLFGEALIESIIKSYTDMGIGIDENDFEREGVFRTEENQRDWCGLNFTFNGLRFHQCITGGDNGCMFTVTFTGMNHEDEQKVLNTFTENTTVQNDDSPAGKEPPETADNMPLSDGSAEYILMDGKMKVEIPSSYDVLCKGNGNYTEEFAASHGTTKDKLDLWLSLQGNDLIAVAPGAMLGKSSDEICIRIKPGKYTGVDNFKDFSDADKKYLADAMISGFSGTDGYQFYDTEDAAYIVFNMNVLGEQLRYATIVDEAMIYIFYESAEGPVTDEERQILQQIVDTVRFYN